MSAIEEVRPTVRDPRRLVLLALATIFAAVIATLALLPVPSTHEPAQREGPVAMVDAGGAPVMWMLLKHEEQRGRRLSRKLLWDTWYHLELYALDPRTARPLWTRSLLQLKYDQGGHGARARILGQQGERVWIYLNDGPLALAASDGRTLADRAAIEQQNPALQGMMPRELEFYTWFDGLVITAADGRRHRLEDASGFTFVDFEPPDANAFSRAEFMSSQWNGGWNTRDFLLRGAMLDGRWIGLHSPREAEDVARDEWGDKYKDPSTAWDEGDRARRAVWVARTETIKKWADEPAYERIAALERAPGAPEFLQGGLLAHTGQRVPLAVGDSHDVLVLHRTRLDEHGRLALTRVDRAFQPRWSRELPLLELANRWELPGHLVLFGQGVQAEPPVPLGVETVVALNLQDGTLATWTPQTDARPQAPP